MLVLSPNDLQTLQHSCLFQQIDPNQIHHLCTCFHGEIKSFKKNETIFSTSQEVTQIGLILEGSIHVERFGYDGKRHLVSRLAQGDIFAESIAATLKNTYNLSVVSNSESRILFFEYDRLLKMCEKGCSSHSQILVNLISFLSSRNVFLQEKLTYITQPSLEEKLLSYLSVMAKKQHSTYFTIPFNRQELADFLNADRSAVSAALSRLKEKGILDTYKNQFHFLKDPHHFFD